VHRAVEKQKQKSDELENPTNCSIFREGGLFKVIIIIMMMMMMMMMEKMTRKAL